MSNKLYYEKILTKFFEDIHTTFNSIDEINILITYLFFVDFTRREMKKDSDVKLCSAFCYILDVYMIDEKIVEKFNSFIKK
jgi:hypothetical protein